MGRTRKDGKQDMRFKGAWNPSSDDPTGDSGSGCGCGLVIALLGIGGGGYAAYRAYEHFSVGGKTLDGVVIAGLAFFLIAGVAIAIAAVASNS